MTAALIAGSLAIVFAYGIWSLIWTYEGKTGTRTQKAMLILGSVLFVVGLVTSYYVPA